MSSQPAPAYLWEHALYAIDLTLEHPHGAHYMPKAPTPSSGIIAFPASLDSKWLDHLAGIPNKALLKEQKRLEYLHFLQNPKVPPVAANGYRKSQRKSFKHVALRDFELGDGLPHLYHKSVVKKGKTLPPKYAACENDAFRIIANVHSQFHHHGIKKTMTEVGRHYHGITERNVKWVIDQCVVCTLNKGNKTKPIIRPIVSEGCLDRVQIDLMDFHAKADGDAMWILQVKDHFSCFVWLYPLEDKTATAVATCIDEWFMYNGYPLLLQCDNGNEFKGELLTLCQQIGVEVINGPPYRPQTQESVESANKTFKRRLTSLRTEFGTDEWVRYLKPIALALNTTRHESLEAGVSPYEVHFGRPPRWTFRGPAAFRPGGFEEDEEEEEGAVAEGEDDGVEARAVEEAGEEEAEDEVEEEVEYDVVSSAAEEDKNRDSENEGNNKDTDSLDGYESAIGSQFTVMEQAMLKHKERRNQLLLEKQVRQNTVVFYLTKIATLHIPPKMRGQGEAKRLPVRIYSKPYENGYILITQWGRLRGSYLHEDLNKELEDTQKEIGAKIPSGHIDLDGDVLPLVNLTKAVQGYMRRRTVAAGQKNGRKRARTANPLPTPHKRAYKPRGPRQPQLSLEELGLIDPTLTDAAQAEAAVQRKAARLQGLEAKKAKKHSFKMVLVLESSEEEFENPSTILTRTQLQSRALTEPL